jgi:hypothetical protein
MSQTAKEPEFVQVERLLEAPIIYVDTVPKFSVREQMISVTLAATVVELVSKLGAHRSYIDALYREQLTTFCVRLAILWWIHPTG